VKIYIAAPLFSESERAFNKILAESISDVVEVFLPQEHVGLISDYLDLGLSIDEAKKTVFTRDVEALRNSHALIAVLDGQCVDEGVAVEIGMAWTLGKTCVGIQTDFRRACKNNNPMISSILDECFGSVAELRQWFLRLTKTVD